MNIKLRKRKLKKGRIKLYLDIKHETYTEGANMYVAKYICDDKVNYNLIKNS